MSSGGPAIFVEPNGAVHLTAPWLSICIEPKNLFMEANPESLPSLSNLMKGLSSASSYSWPSMVIFRSIHCIPAIRPRFSEVIGVRSSEIEVRSLWDVWHPERSVIHSTRTIELRLALMAMSLTVSNRSHLVARETYFSANDISKLTRTTLNYQWVLLSTRISHMTS